MKLKTDHEGSDLESKNKAIIETNKTGSIQKRLNELSEIYPEFKAKTVQDAFIKLRKCFNLEIGVYPKVYSVLTHISRSGHLRSFILIIPVCKFNEVWELDYYIKTLFGYKIHKKGGNVLKGQDSYDLIMDLSYLLFGNSYLLSNERMNY